ncbi:helix-turn-helix domain-containing protein [Kribbella sp. NPDC056951]|uniref:helix-turn-helix domain-containing protein n=1 Tax=Kribbella sp. NPDC056951 TaxID=3345978 RepID=UPI003630925C
MTGGDTVGSAKIAQVLPDPSEAATADLALRRITRYLSMHADERELRVVVDGDPDESLSLPRSAVELLARVLAHMAAGQGVSVVPAHAELTTQQAADLLNVSRPYLIGLLDTGDIEYRKVGKHRRVRADSLMNYKRKDDQERRAAVDELAELDQDMDLY